MYKFINFLLFFLLIGCSEKDFIKEDKIPIEKFVLLQQDLSVDFCLSDSDLCVNTEFHSNGSGFFTEIDYNHEVSYVLTANHICDPSKYSLLEYEKQGFDVFITNNFITVNNFLGESLNAQIYKFDIENDLCILRVDSTSVEPMVLSETNPDPLDKVINIAAPSAVWEPTAVIVFDGRFSGINKFNQNVYSLPTHPGSSGSPILNDKNEFIGIITMASSNLSIGYGATRNSIEEFLKSSN